MSLSGVDVSSFQGAYNWTSEKFGFAKATEGTFYQDTQFAHNWNTMWSKKILRGAYHFGHPGTDAKSQAKYFVNFVRSHGLETNDALALDLEVTDGKTATQVAAWVAAFCDEVKSLCGKNVIIYTTATMAGNGSCKGSYNQPLWIADPNNLPGTPGPIGGWKVWSFHQYSWTPVDKDYFTGDASTWAAIVNTPGKGKLPAPGGMSQTATETFTDFGWSGVAGATAYDFQLIEGSTQVARQDVSKGSVRIPTKPGTTYKWRVAAAGNNATWSALKQFTTPVNPAEWSYPAPGNLRIGQGTATFPVEWAAVSHDGKAAASYTVQILDSTGKLFQSHADVAGVSLSVTLPRGTYTARVWANGGPKAPAHTDYKFTV